MPNILVLYNQPVLPPDHPEAGSEYDILDTVANTEKVLASAGFEVRKLGINYDPRPLLDEIHAHPPDTVFNLFEGLATQTGTEVSVAALLEWLNLPFTGSPSAALALGRDKVSTKHLLTAAGLPTPEYLVIDRPPAPPWTAAWPAIVKPACQDASIGIDQGSVVTSQEQLEARARYVLVTYGGPVLVERFVFGRELHVNVIGDGQDGLLVLPPTEVEFRHTDPDRWPIYSFAAKWNVDCEEFKSTPLRYPVELPAETTERVRAIAVKTFRVLQCRDYARLDLRMTADGGIQILEMNPNPYLNSEALVNGMDAIGRTHERLVVDITLAALARGGKPVPPGAIRVPVGVSLV
jgi:D-alanine-D-alanine ligase